MPTASATSVRFDEACEGVDVDVDVLVVAGNDRVIDGGRVTVGRIIDVAVALTGTLNTSALMSKREGEEEATKVSVTVVASDS